MILSSLLTPFRVYDQYHDLDKFKKDCNSFCGYELITDKTRLLPFQFLRPASPYGFNKIWMRPACTDFYHYYFREGIRKFLETGYFGLNYVTIEEGYAKATDTMGGTGYISKPVVTVAGTKCYVKVITNDVQIATGNPFYAKVYQNATLIGDASTAGVHIFEFTATGADTIKLETSLTGTDYMKFDEFSVYTIADYSLSYNDVLLSIDVEIKTTGVVDIINYCGSAFDNTLPCGAYYLIFKTNDGVYYFSEVFTVKNFLPEESPYVLLEWSNLCDLQNVKFTGMTCNYVNRLYVDGPITTPEYPFKEEVQEDGNQTPNIIFQKWEKEKTIIVPKAPEYLVDALTAMRLHDTIKYYDRLRKNQSTITEFTEVEKMEYDVKYIFSDCAANVDLKMVLKDRFVDSTCCEEITLLDCTCDYTISEIEVYNPAGRYALSTDPNTGALTFYTYNATTETWELTSVPVETVICASVSGKYYYWDGTNWIEVPKILTAVDNTTSVTITANIMPNTYGQITFVYQSVTYVYPTLYTKAQLSAGVTINYADIAITRIACQVLTISVHDSNFNCDFGTSTPHDLLFDGPEC